MTGLHVAAIDETSAAGVRGIIAGSFRPMPDRRRRRPTSAQVSGPRVRPEVAAGSARPAWRAAATGTP
jgi:hypothetical protein